MNTCAGCPPRRFLILTASMGRGHDAVTAELASRLADAGHRVVCADVLDLLPGRIGAGLRTCYKAAIRHVPAAYGGVYAAFFHERPGVPGADPLAALASPRLLGRITRLRPHVVVSAFHLAAQVTGRLRERGVLPIPSAVVVTDFAVHRQWLHPGNDLHLCLAPELATHVRRSTGRLAVSTGPLVAQRFQPAPGRRAVQGTRRRRGRNHPPEVLISTGAWGAATGIERTVVLLAESGFRPVVLCGQNERLRRRLARTARAVPLGWVDDMPSLMARSDVLIDNAAGQTAQQALAIGLPVIGYRPIPGHGAEGVRRMADLGLSEFVQQPGRLPASLLELSEPGPLRRQRIAAGRSLFRGTAVASLEDLAASWPAGPPW